MRGAEARSQAVDRLVTALQAGQCDEATARELYRLGPEAVTLALLAAARQIAKQHAQLAALQSNAANRGVSPSTPSGMIPVYSKPNAAAARGRRRKKRGARDGHPGRHRPPPTRIDQRQDHRLEACPFCGGPLQRCQRSRTRIIEDLLETLQTEVTEHTLHRDYCPACKKHVEPVVPDALPNATFGHRLISFTSWCHYGLAVRRRTLFLARLTPRGGASRESRLTNPNRRHGASDAADTLSGASRARQGVLQTARRRAPRPGGHPPSPAACRSRSACA
jgi:ribosomal protein L44E